MNLSFSRVRSYFLVLNYAELFASLVYFESDSK